VRFTLRAEDGASLPPGCACLLRTNLGRGAFAPAGDHLLVSAAVRRCQCPRGTTFLWNFRAANGRAKLTLAETASFARKLTPSIPMAVSTGPTAKTAACRSSQSISDGNTIYCAFIRMFGETKERAPTANPELTRASLNSTPRVTRSFLPRKIFATSSRNCHFIIDTLGCRILHLLPVNPTPTVFARFGRFGSPYASQDLTGIDPRSSSSTTHAPGIDQFRELTYATHARGGRVFIDIVINHTGWGARCRSFIRMVFCATRRKFVSPGAWGTIGKTSAELDHRGAALCGRVGGNFSRLVPARRGWLPLRRRLQSNNVGACVHYGRRARGIS